MTENSPQTLIVELLTEELPPKNLLRLSKDFSEGIIKNLNNDNLLDKPFETKIFATPRRLAVMIKNVRSLAMAKKTSRKIMPASIGIDSKGYPTEALKKKMEILGFPIFSINSFKKFLDRKTEYLFYEETLPRKNLQTSLQHALQNTIENLSDYKKMQYQLHNGESITFIRPAINLMVLHGQNLVDVSILGLQSSNKTLGHRFLCDHEIVLNEANLYEETLFEKGKVIACYDKRLSKISHQLKKSAKNASLIKSNDLLNEVTSLVEWPFVYTCHFDKNFLSVPKECLILTMQTQQRYFGLSDKDGHLIPSFLVVSNIETSTPKQIINGNEMVIRPRFADAKFFFEQDRLVPLYQRIAALENITYHQKLGSQADRVKRLEIISQIIGLNLEAHSLNCTYDDIHRAALLAKADLTTNMVIEFPELQGIMGSYYAKADGESEKVANACAEHYLPRYAGDALPESSIGKIIAISDKIETLLSMTLAEGLPKNDKDPMALRRHALGLMRILTEGSVDINLIQMLKRIYNTLVEKNLLPNKNNLCETIFTFCIERLKNYLHEKHFSWDEIHSVLPESKDFFITASSLKFPSILPKLDAIQKFNQLDEAHSLASINKRIRNILHKSKNEQITSFEFNKKIATKQVEINLAEKIDELFSRIEIDLERGNFHRILHSLLELRQPIDLFFEMVMVNDPDKSIKNNRLSLLNKAYQLMNIIADISKLAN